MAHLQQILTLRHLGFPLRRIGGLLAARPDFDLLASLRAQRQALRDRAADIERIESALVELLTRRQSSGHWDWTLVNRLTWVVQGHLSEKGQNVERYYTPEQMAQFAELAERTPDIEIQAIETGWTELIAELRSSRHLDPASPEARNLVRRWDALQERTQQAYADHQDLWGAIGENYAAGRFDEHPEAPSREDFAFIKRARHAAETE